MYKNSSRVIISMMSLSKTYPGLVTGVHLRTDWKSATPFSPGILYRVQGNFEVPSFHSTTGHGESGQQHDRNSWGFSSRGLPWAFVSAGTVLAIGAGAYQKYKQTKERDKTAQMVFLTLPRLGPSSVLAAEDDKSSPGELKKGLPTYSMEEVSKHVSKENRIWVTYKKGVYDITDYIRLHPGGKMILMAAGKSMEPFWEKFSIHQNDAIYEMLEYFRIGNITEAPNKKSNNPDRDVKPWMLPKRKILDVDLGDSSMIMMENLKKDFQKKTVMTAVKCSSDKTEKKEMKWTGVSLGELLRAQKVDLDKVESKFLVFESLQKKPDNTPFTCLYPMEMVRALQDDILIAYEMNDEPIPPIQGHPFRVILKGHGGGKQVKWLHRIRFSTKEEDDS